MTSKPKTFAEAYCALRGIDEADFCKSVIKRSLHAPLRWLVLLHFPLNRHYFEADYELVRFAGRLTRTRELEGEIREFNFDHRNRKIWRGLLRQRVSTRRLRRLFRDTVHTIRNPSEPTKDRATV